MASSLQPEADTASASSFSLSHSQRSRRDSVASFPATSLEDKEALTQALNDIHHTASRSGTLTAFNDFTPAPPPSVAEGKGIAGELQGGLSGLYNRFRASVGGVKDIVGSNSTAAREGDGGGKDDTSMRSSALEVPASTPGTKQTSLSNKSGSFSIRSPKDDLTSHLQSPSGLSVSTEGIDKDSSQSAKVSRAHTAVSAKITSPTSGFLKGPLAQARPSRAATPAVAEVTISAVKDGKISGSRSEEHEESIPRSASRSTAPSRQDEERNQTSEPRRPFYDQTGKLDSQIESVRLGYTSKAGNDVKNANVKPDIPSSTLLSGPSEEKGRSRPQYGTRLSSFKTGDDKSVDNLETSGIKSGETQSLLSAISRHATNDLPSKPVGGHLANDTFPDLKPPASSRHDESKSAEKALQSSRVGASEELLTKTQDVLSKPPTFSVSRPSTVGADQSDSSSISKSFAFDPSRESQPGDKGLGGPSFSGHKHTNPDPQTAENRSARVLYQIRSKVLNKEFWMKDENARDCFNCGDSFSTFRRKHHCRTCGQIFDSKCTSLVSGRPFGQSGSLRVCRPCESMIMGYDDSSEASDDGALPVPSLRPRHGSTSASDASPSSNMQIPRGSPSRNQHGAFTGLSDHMMPTMGILATRKIGSESKRQSRTILELESDRALPRPGSSRSLKSSLGIRSNLSGHKRHNSRYQTHRGVKTLGEESAPFHRNPSDDSSRNSRLPAFHSDNIIDPDLAAFLSDEESSGDEQLNLMAALNGDSLATSYDNERSALAGLFASAKKNRSKLGDKSMSGMTGGSRDADNISLSSARGSNAPRSSKRRNLSVAGNLHMRPSPRPHRFSTAFAPTSSHLQESLSSATLAQMNDLQISGDSSRVKRSSSMKGADAPAVELNSASVQHVRKLLRQLLQSASVSGVNSWEKALIPILLQATDDVNPNVQNGDDPDVRHFVKLKKIPGGRPGDTSYVSGLVFTKNLALKSMSRKIAHPDILILTFSLEYARHHQQFLSLEPVIRQEREFLQNIVNRIAASRPQLLLVARNVSGLALEFLEKANIATAYNVKPSVLEAVSRCSQTRVITSIDKLSVKPMQAGKCADFYVKTYIESGRKKTYMFLTGCPKELGCTIVLRGASTNTLIKIKQITEFMVYVVYNLKLETCLLRDEFALIPSYTELGSLSHGPDPAEKAAYVTHTSSGDAITKTSNKLIEQEIEKDQNPADAMNADVLKTERAVFSDLHNDRVSSTDKLPEDIPEPTFYGDMVAEHKTKILSASPFVKFMQPYLLMRAREQERRLLYLRRLRDQDNNEEQDEKDEPKPERFVLIRPEMVHEAIHHPSRKVREVLRAVHDAEYDKALHNYRTQKKQWESYISGSIDLFDPYVHQNIAVLFSVVCTATSVPCSGPDILAFGFYNSHVIDVNFGADCTLGQYVESVCMDADAVCEANGCERKMQEHHRQYVHGEAQMSVFLEHYPCKLRGLQDVILMWSTCRICGQETQVMPMSDSTWKYSFGKYLELSFWSTELHPRAGICPHDIHKHHLRYFGLKDMALRVQIDPITLLEIIVPRMRITWKVDNDLRFKNEVYTRTEERLNKFMMSVKARIRCIKVESVLPDKVDDCRDTIECLLKRADEEHHALTRKLQDKYMNSKYYEILPMNRAMRAVQEKVAEWDTTFADFDRNFFPSEKDIRRLTTLQLKKIFLDRDDSVTSLTSDQGTAPPSGGPSTEKTSPEDTPASTSPTRTMSPEKAHDVLTSVVEEHASILETGDKSESAPPTAIPPTRSRNTETFLQSPIEESMNCLDLAVPSNFSGGVPDPETILASDSSSTSLVKTMKSNEHDTTRQATPAIVEPTQSAGAPPAQELRPTTKKSGIPRPPDVNLRRAGSSLSPTLYRAQSQPPQIRREKSSGSSSGGSTALQPKPISTDGSKRLSEPQLSPEGSKQGETRISDRLGFGTLRSGAMSAQSMIPRSIANRRKETRVSTLAKHFEQLSREFEKERLRDRRQRAAKSRQARAYPRAASKPIVEIYRNVHDAVEERTPSDEELILDPLPSNESNGSLAKDQNTSVQVPEEGFHAEDTYTKNAGVDKSALENPTADENLHMDHAGSDVDVEGSKSDDDHPMLDDLHIPDLPPTLSPGEVQLDTKLDLPKYEKNSLMKILTNFWAERSASGWHALDYPLDTSVHVFADSDIIVREDEPSSLIAFALGSGDYQAKLQSISEIAEVLRSKCENANVEDQSQDAEIQIEVERSLLRSTGTHLKYQYSEGSARMLCKIFFAEQFDAVRRKCGVADRIVPSLSRCMKWDSKGGKTKSVFLKTLDDRFVLKSLSPIETQAFLRFAPAYFRIMSEAMFHELPSVIAKMLGFYQVVIKNPVTGVEFNWFLLCMENLFYDRSPTRIFDLKGSMRNRKIESTGEQDEVLLDENMVEFIYESPLFARDHSKKLLGASVFNDTLFLQRQNVMDYSLMIAIDENRKELVVGIIDCIRTYTWDKKLETWIKDRGKNRPTVTSPREYKNRFREAMGRYVLQAPNCWHQFTEPGLGQGQGRGGGMSRVGTETAMDSRADAEGPVVGV